MGSTDTAAVRKVTQLVRDFLAEVRPSNGGWAEIVPKDLDQLSRIVHTLIDLKCQPDAGGDRPIQFRLINRRLYEPLHYLNVEYDYDVEGPVEVMKALRARLDNLQIAARTVDTFCRIQESHVNQATNQGTTSEES